jgi:aminobutyraldehyde dehydrogenase
MTTQTEQFTVRRSDAHTSLPLQLPPAGHFINGSFVPGSTGLLIDVVDPTTEQVIASVQAGTAGDVDAAVAAAVVAQKTWDATTPKERADVLNLIANIIEENRAAFEAIESANTGKPQAVSEDDVSSTIDTFRFMAGASRTLTSMAGGDYATGHTSVILREPVGVVGVITPWNYPLLMAAWKIAPILAAGNSIVIKPSEQTPLSTLKLVEVLAGRIPDGILNVVTGRGRTVGQRLSEHPDIALVALTGSVVSGQAVAETAAKSVKRVHLELGGKAPVVVFPDADLRAAAAGVRNAGFWNAGQDCGAACRVLVHESVAEEFTAHLVREVSTLVIGAPDAGDDVEIGPMISLPHYERVKESLAEARGQASPWPSADPPWKVPGTSSNPQSSATYRPAHTSPPTRSSAPWSPWKPSAPPRKP